MQQNVYVNQTNSNGGCGSGCVTTFAVLIIIGLAVKYWYISAALAVVAIGVGVWYHRHQRALTVPGPPPAIGTVQAQAAQMLAGQCSSCGQATAGNFCAHCGTAQTRVCSHCATPGLTSPYCPQCGAATYLPPAPI